MLKTQNYSNAYKEVYVILENMDSQDIEKIPKEFIKMIECKMNKDYEFEIDNNSFETKEILKETKAILAYIFLNYLATEEQQYKIKQKFKQDILKDENRKRDKYNTKNIFTNKQIKDSLPISNETSIVVYKTSIFIKIKKWIKTIFLK